MTWKKRKHHICLITPHHQEHFLRVTWWVIELFGSPFFLRLTYIFKQARALSAKEECKMKFCCMCPAGPRRSRNNTWLWERLSQRITKRILCVESTQVSGHSWPWFDIPTLTPTYCSLLFCHPLTPNLFLWEGLRKYWPLSVEGTSSLITQAYPLLCPKLFMQRSPPTNGALVSSQNSLAM